MVDPNANAEGSTSVACWLEVFVNVSVLSLVKATGGGGGGGGVFELLLPEPQPTSRVKRPVNKSGETREKENIRRQKLIGIECTPAGANPSLTQADPRTYNRGQEDHFMAMYGNAQGRVIDVGGGTVGRLVG